MKVTLKAKLFAVVLGTALCSVVMMGCDNASSSVIENNGIDVSNNGSPTNVTAEKSTTKNNVKVKWDDTGAAYYWVYYNNTNDVSTATIRKTSLDGTYGVDIALTSSGTYYFWVKAADDSSTTSSTSDFSNPTTFAFTYQ